MTKYLLFIACSLLIIGCRQDDKLALNCGDPAAPYYEPIYIRLVDNGGTNLFGTANYDVSKMRVQQTCSNAPLSDVTIKKGLIDGNTDSATFLRIELAREYNGNLCGEFTMKWNDTDTDTYTIDFRDSSVTHNDGCKSYYYFQKVNENGTAVARNNNMKTDNAAHDDNNGYSTYYTITK